KVTNSGTEISLEEARESWFCSIIAAGSLLTPIP
ncbi:unnamed protein product, partial [marine sediment metagenome]